MVFCENCGSKMKDNEAFCPVCGAANENVTQQEDTSAGVTQQGRYIPHSYQQAQDDIQPGLRQPQQGELLKRYHSGFSDQLSAPVRSWGAWFGIALAISIVGTSIFGYQTFMGEYFSYFTFPFGIVYALYIYNNFNDFETYINNVHSSNPSVVRSPISPSVAALIVILAIPLKLSLGNYYVDNWAVSGLIAISPVFILIYIKNKMLYEHLEQQAQVDRGTNAGGAFLITFFTFMLGAVYVDWKWQHTFNKHIKRTEGFYV